MTADLEIGRIRIRAANLTAEQGRQLGDRVADLLAERLARGEGRSRDLHLLQARVSAQRGQTVEELAAQVVAAILEAM